MAKRDEAIAVQSEDVYQRYLKYLTGCADVFDNGYIDVNQFTLQKEHQIGVRPPPNARV